MSKAESAQHLRIKEYITSVLHEIAGISLSEYPSSGHELDIYGITSDGISLYIEIIWSPSSSNFIRDLNLIQQSDAQIKIIVVNPDILTNEEFIREFSKVVVSQRRFGVAFLGDMLDGYKLLNNKDYFKKEFKEKILELLSNFKKESIQIKGSEFIPPSIIAIPNKKEELISNLFSIKKLPEYVFICNTYVKNKYEVKCEMGYDIKEPYVIKNHRIFTFNDLTRIDSPFYPLIREPIKKIYYKDYIIDDNNKRDFIYLLNESLKFYSELRLIRYIENKRKYMCLLKDGETNFVKWRNEKVYSKREVAKPLIDKNGNLLCCLHYAADLRYLILENSFFLKIEPTMIFTIDGINEVNAKLRTKLNKAYLPKQFNDIYLGNVRFWAKMLSKLSNNLKIQAGSQLIEINANPASTYIYRGV